MTRPDDTLWALEEHSRAKHMILRSYLSAWLPIMSKYNRRLVLIDGFAGPGQYTGGEDGSPLIMLKAFLEHDHRRLINAELVYLFIEEREDRAAYLEGEIAKLTLPKAQVKYDVVHGAFQDVFRDLLDHIQGQGQALAPTFAFIDPFGYTDAPFDLTGRFLQFARCEVLIYIPLPWVVRFVGRAGQERAMTALFGGDDWRPAVDLRGEERKAFLHDLFRDQLKHEGGVEYVRSFEIITRSGTGGYHLFFGTGHPTGLDRMKSAMWRVDPREGRQFRDSTRADQLVLLEPEPDLAPLRSAIVKHFSGKEFTIDELEMFALIDTPFLPTHVRRVLKPLENDGKLAVLSERKRRGTYPSGTRLRLVG